MLFLSRGNFWKVIMTNDHMSNAIIDIKVDCVCPENIWMAMSSDIDVMLLIDFLKSLMFSTK